MVQALRVKVQGLGHVDPPNALEGCSEVQRIVWSPLNPKP